MDGTPVEGPRLRLPRPGSRPSRPVGAPQLADNLVPRQRLLDLLDAAVRAPITVVLAPAGAGKTSMLVAWCAQRETVPVGWASLDETDGSVEELWAAVVAALRHLLVDHLDGLAGQAGDEPSPQGVKNLLDQVTKDHPDVAVLVISDFHCLDADAAATRPLERLLRMRPDWLHLVVSSRQMPLLPIHRLRARGQLSEVLFDELRFSPEESLEVVTRLAPWLPPAEAEAVAQRADGWAAGLQLSVLGARAERAQGSERQAVRRTELMVSDYVWHEVLGQESSELIQVLLDVSVVTGMNAALAAALAEREDAGELLLQAESRGLFVNRVGTGDRLEIHELVRGVLLAEAVRRDPDRVRDRHARAAQWFEDHGDIDDVRVALGHWLSADDARAALRLLARHVTDLYDTGREETISTTLATIPVSVARGDLDAEIDLAWCRLLVDKTGFLEEVREVVRRAAQADQSPTTLGRVQMLDSIAATSTGCWSEGGQQALEALQLLGPDGWADPYGRFAWNMVARDQALSESWDDQTPSLQDARSALSRDPERRLSFEGISALGYALAGHPLDALRAVAGASEYARVRSMTILRVELAMAEALAHRELGERERARADLAAVTEGWVGPVTHAAALAHLELVEICLDNADLEGARKAFGQADMFTRAEFTGSEGLSWLARRGVLVSLAAGDLDSAARWNDRVEDKFWHGIGEGRLRLHRGERTEAVEALSMVTPRCSRHEVTRGLLLALALPEDAESIDVYAPVLSLAVRTGMMQTVASEGPEILDVLDAHPWLAPDPWLARVHRAVPPSRRVGITQIALPGEHLTDRELGVLRMLPSRLTTREIGEELGISVNTVKFHLRVIYRKLGVSSRNEAAAMARTLRRQGNPPRG